MAAKIILVLACVAIIAQLTIASPAQVLQTITIEPGFQDSVGEIAANNSVLTCVPCASFGVCDGRCCDVPPFSQCIISNGHCYCG